MVYTLFFWLVWLLILPLTLRIVSSGWEIIYVFVYSLAGLAGYFALPSVLEKCLDEIDWKKHQNQKAIDRNKKIFLEEQRLKLIKTENRLSRNMQSIDLTDKINIKLTHDAANRITRDTVLALGLSDINKPFAKKMDYLAGVWDVSEGKAGNGYWIVEVTVAQVNKEGLIPLYWDCCEMTLQKFLIQLLVLLALKMPQILRNISQTLHFATVPFTGFFLIQAGKKSLKNQYLTQGNWSLDLSKI